MVDLLLVCSFSLVTMSVVCFELVLFLFMFIDINSLVSDKIFIYLKKGFAVL